MYTVILLFLVCESYFLTLLQHKCKAYLVILSSGKKAIKIAKVGNHVFVRFISLLSSFVSFTLRCSVAIAIEWEAAPRDVLAKIR